MSKDQLEAMRSQIDFYLAKKKKQDMLETDKYYQILTDVLMRAVRIQAPAYYILRKNNKKLFDSVTNFISSVLAWCQSLPNAAIKQELFLRLSFAFVCQTVITYYQGRRLSISFSVIAQLKQNTVIEILQKQFPGYNKELFYKIILKKNII